MGDEVICEVSGRPRCTAGFGACEHEGRECHGGIDCLAAGYERSQAALAAARRECEARAIALRNIVGVWREVHDDAKHRRMWILGWETWLRVIAEGAALAAPAAGEERINVAELFDPAGDEP